MGEISARRLYVDGPYGQVHLREARPAGADTGKMPIICFHQSPLSGVQYKPFQDAMAVDRLVWCADTPGFGGSDAPSDVVTVADYATAMAVVLEGLGYGQDAKGQVDVFGGHTGSAIGTELAVSRPDLVRRIVYPSMALFSAEQRRTMLERFGGPPPYFADPDFVCASYRQTVLDGPTELSPERRLELFTERLRSGVKAWFAPEAVLNYDIGARLAEMEQPALILALDDMLADNGRRAAEIIQNVKLVELGHVPHKTAFDVYAEEIATVVRGFLDAV